MLRQRAKNDFFSYWHWHSFWFIITLYFTFLTCGRGKRKMICGFGGVGGGGDGFVGGGRRGKEM